jgi:hypothetical protein
MRIVVLFVLLILLMVNAEAQSSGQEPSALPSLDQLSATRDRPLFSPDRRKPAPPPAVAPLATPQQQPQKPKFTLMGIIVTSSETIVLLQDAGTSELITVRSGQSVGRWQIVANSNYSAKITDGKEEFTLQMFAEP